MHKPLLSTEEPTEAQIAERLRTEPIIWLTTVNPNGTPHAVPVWFHWSDPTVTAFSRPRTVKIRNLRWNRGVSLHLDSHRRGADIVLLEGHAELDPPGDLDSIVESFEQKYRPMLGVQSITAWRDTFSQPITIVAQKLIAWTRTEEGLDYRSLSTES